MQVWVHQLAAMAADGIPYTACHHSNSGWAFRDAGI
jgi:hypothetical protein